MMCPGDLSLELYTHTHIYIYCMFVIFVVENRLGFCFSVQLCFLTIDKEEENKNGLRIKKCIHTGLIYHIL